MSSLRVGVTAFVLASVAAVTAAHAAPGCDAVNGGQVATARSLHSVVPGIARRCYGGDASDISTDWWREARWRAVSEFVRVDNLTATLSRHIDALGSGRAAQARRNGTHGYH